MNTRTVMLIAAVIALIFAAGLLLMPASMATLYGMGASPSEILLARFFGVTLLTVGLINWFAKDADYSTLHPIFLGNMIGDFVGAAVTVMGVLGGVMNALGWSSVAIYLLLGLAFAYLQFMGQPVNVRPRA